MADALDDAVFFSDVDPHLPGRVSSADAMRIRLLLHVVLAGPLVIGDSQSLNNPIFRQLLVRNEDTLPEPRDIATLLREGAVRIARRDTTASLRSIRDEHASRNVENVPGIGYTEILDELSADHPLTYSLADVQDRFKSGVVAQIAQEIAPSLPTGVQRILRDAEEWVQRQEVLFYNSVHIWQRELTNPDDPETLLAIDIFEDVTGRAYRLALPQAINAAIAGQRDPAIDTLETVRSNNTLHVPTTLLSPRMWEQLPVEALREMLAMPNRAEVLKGVRDIRLGITSPAFAPALAAFAEGVDAVVRRTFAGADNGVLAASDYLNFVAEISEVTDDETGRQGVLMTVVDAATLTAVPGGFLDLTAMPYPLSGVDERPYVTNVAGTESQSRSRMVTAADIAPRV